MPPRKSTRVAARPKKQPTPSPSLSPSPSPPPPPPPAPPSLPLDGCHVALCGNFPIKQPQMRDILTKLGATPLASVTAAATHLIASDGNCRKPTDKVKQAVARGLPIVMVDWLLISHTTGTRADERDFVPAPLRAATPPAAPAPAPAAAAAPATSANGKRTKASRKRSASPPPPANVDSTAAPSAPDPKKAKTTTVASDPAKASPPTAHKGGDSYRAEKDIYVDGDGLIWDASLNQTNSGNNNNKFYKIRILRGSKGLFMVWTNWGRVGENGQTSEERPTPNFDDAVKAFKKKFRQKTGLAWEDRDEDPRPGKYAYVERTYESDSDDTDKADAEDAAEKKDKARAEPLPPVPECTLAPPVQRLMKIIFNRSYFAATMADLNYDANKLPLGKLSSATIRRGFQMLKNLAALLDDQSLAASTYHVPYPTAVEQLSNLYYSVIPHAFGRNRPPVIGAYGPLKREIELLESLSDMKDAELLMAVDQKVSGLTAANIDRTPLHPLDQQYRGLGLTEMTPLDPAGAEHAALAAYLLETRGQTHSVRYELQAIFRVARAGERERFAACTLDGGSGVQPDSRLLWHGSRTTNFGGILGQGLRIAPPEAPVSGYMFGKGIYLADLSSKSAGYCCPGSSGGTGLLLLCEAKLGAPMLTLDNASYEAGNIAKQKGLYATLGQGVTEPLGWKDAACVHADLAGVQMPDVSKKIGPSNKPSAVQYNEYIVYDVAQVCLRYLFQVRMM